MVKFSPQIHYFTTLQVTSISTPVLWKYIYSCKRYFQETFVRIIKVISFDDKKYLRFIFRFYCQNKSLWIYTLYVQLLGNFNQTHKWFTLKVSNKRTFWFQYYFLCEFWKRINKGIESSFGHKAIFNLNSGIALMSLQNQLFLRWFIVKGHKKYFLLLDLLIITLSTTKIVSND